LTIYYCCTKKIDDDFRNQALSAMEKSNEKKLQKIKKLLAWYNMIPNLVWSVLNLVPISVFCFTLMGLQTFYTILAISIVPVFFKKSFLDKLQIGKTTAVYKKLGVHHINTVAQNGVLINKLVKNKYPQYKAVTSKQASINRLIAQTYVFEKFHWVCFLFFSLATIYAISTGHWYWVFIISLTNIAYNVYPNLLQQYIRLKLLIFRKR
jgi:Glycosyl-4,4'-diaponeurosporenoate acyltransferase